MIVLGTSWCHACRELKARGLPPGYRYLEVPARCEDRGSEEWRAKEAVARLGIRGFPVVVDDGMTRVLGYPFPVSGAGGL
jgi:hypothetical protein